MNTRSGRGRWTGAGLLVLSLLLGCTGEGARPGGVDHTLSQTWIARIVADPALFSTTVDRGGRDGWIAFHRNDWLGASTGGGAAEWRAWQELSGFYDVLADLSALTWVKLGDTWTQRGGLPAGSLLPLLVSWAAADTGDAAMASAWSARAVGGDTDESGRLMVAWRGRDPWDPPAEALTRPVGERLALHGRVRAGQAELMALRSAGAQPLHVEPVALQSGVNRTFFDPMLYRTLHVAADAALLAHPVPVEALESQLFSSTFGVPEQSDAAVLVALGVSLPTGGDLTEPCREAVRGLDTALDGWRAELGGSASPEGRALLDDLRLVEGLRARLLTRWAVEALTHDQPACALAYAELAIDHERSREVTPINSPTLLAVLAAARFRTGNVRLALDALESLSAAFPEVLALDETVGDLSVLQGLGRSGDSREN